jgi:gluconate 5-dehydrogenase
MKGISELFGLEGQTAVVTGASSGLGGEAARALATAGAAVGLVARREDRLVTLAEELQGLGGRSCVAAADLTRDEEVERAIEAVERELGPISILLHGAGIAPLGRAERHPRDKWDEVIAVNLTSAFVTAQAVARRMIERGEAGRIIFLSSAIGSGGNPVHRAVGYSATKGGLNNLTRHLAVEWARYNITVNAIAPSYVPTEMTIDPEHGDVAPGQKSRMELFTPMGRLGRPDEIATAVLFLAAPASTYVTGSIVAVDGGWTAW